jgi:hypothetical protein
MICPKLNYHKNTLKKFRMKHYMIISITFMIIFIGATIAGLSPNLALADSSASLPGDSGGSTTTYQTGLPTVSADNGVRTVLQLVFGVVGVLALLIIIISALRFVLSGGDPQSVATARNTIIYAVIGLVVAISAEVIVTYALSHV